MRPLSSATINAGSAAAAALPESLRPRFPPRGPDACWTFPEDVVLLLLDDEEGVFLSVGKSTLELALTGSRC